MVKKILIVATVLLIAVSQHSSFAQYAPSVQSDETQELSYHQDNLPYEIGKGVHMVDAGKTMLFTLAHAKSNKPAFDGNGKPLLNPEAERLYAKAMEMLKPSPQMMHSLNGSMGMARHYYERYLKLGKPGTAGYQFVEESIQYVKQENVPHLHNF